MASELIFSLQVDPAQLFLCGGSSAGRINVELYIAKDPCSPYSAGLFQADEGQ